MYDRDALEGTILRLIVLDRAGGTRPPSRRARPERTAPPRRVAPTPLRLVADDPKADVPALDPRDGPADDT
jgi:hypothetical protein